MRISYRKGPEFIKYVDDLRKTYAIRIQVKSTESHEHVYKRITRYLKKRLSASEWEIQDFTHFNGLHFIWFIQKEDALAFMLTFNGTIV